MSKIWDFLDTAFGWLGKSNRLAHLFGLFIIAAILGWAAGIAAIITAEAKDVQRGDWSAWDWLDVAAGCIGCVLGGAIHFTLLKHW